MIERILDLNMEVLADIRMLATLLLVAVITVVTTQLYDLSSED